MGELPCMRWSAFFLLPAQTVVYFSVLQSYFISSGNSNREAKGGYGFPKWLCVRFDRGKSHTVHYENHPDCISKGKKQQK